MNEILAFALLGVIAGIASGLIGIGGGIIIVPSLVFFMGFNQHQAQGTTLALMIPPIGLLAVLPYYREGYVDVKAAIVIATAFFIGGLLGGKIGVSLSHVALKRVFGGAMLLIAIKMILGK